MVFSSNQHKKDGDAPDIPGHRRTSSHLNSRPRSTVIDEIAIPLHLLSAANSTKIVKADAIARHSSVIDPERGFGGRGDSIGKRNGSDAVTSGMETGGPAARNSGHGRTSGHVDAAVQHVEQLDSVSPINNGEDSKRNTWRSSRESKSEEHQSAGFRKRSVVWLDPSTPQPAHDLPAKHNNLWTRSDPFSSGSSSSGSKSVRKLSYSDASTITQPEPAHVPSSHQPRRGTIASVIDNVATSTLVRRLTNITPPGLQRRGTVWSLYNKAKERSVEIQRKRWAQVLFELGVYGILLCFIYFVLVGRPLWKGAVWWVYWAMDRKLVFAGGWSITLGIAFLYAFMPLMILFEDDPPPAKPVAERLVQEDIRDTALLIPCYKSATILPATLEAALSTFPPSHIFVLANGNSAVPLDDTESVCQRYEVNHLWCPVGSKIVAQFVGCYAAKSFKYALLIDDDCALPRNFPVVTARLNEATKCIGYTIKSVGPQSSKGTLCQQAQDLEYKLGGIQRAFAGMVGSATFPHGAIALWDRDLLLKTFYKHPGFTISEDWFFGHVARQLGSRIKMCTQVFVETETPSAVFISDGGLRGGFGETTVFKQRFDRWNFFFVNNMYYDLLYIVGSWKLGFWELGAKVFVFQEIYETLLYLFTPFTLPISFIVRPQFAAILVAATLAMYLVNTIIFNEIHLRRKNERVSWTTVCIYYTPYKIVLSAINVASCYWSLYKYARYFATRHLKITEDEKAVEIVMRLEEHEEFEGSSAGRRMTVCTVQTRSTLELSELERPDPLAHTVTDGIATFDYAMRRSNHLER